MNALSPIPTSQATAPYKVGNFHKGENRQEVNVQWSRRRADEKSLSISKLKAKVAGREEASSEAVLNTKKIEFFAPVPKEQGDTNILSVGLPDGSEVGPTHWAFNQACSLGKAPASYLRRKPSQFVADALTHDFRYNAPSTEVKAYVVDGELAALTGRDYGRIYDREVVEAVELIAGNGTGDTRWKVPGCLDWSTMTYNPEAPVTLDSTTLYSSDRDVFMFLVDDRNPIEVGKLPDGSPDLMFRGFYASNSEVGAEALMLAAFYLRAVCMNRNLWGVEGFSEIRMIHSKYAPSRFMEQARPALESFANGSERKLIEGVKAAKAAVIADDEDDAIAFLQARDFSRKKAMEILAQGEREEQRPVRTVWDMAQALTANARALPNTDERIKIEKVARRILDKVA